jgi:hypothetical protein
MKLKRAIAAVTIFFCCIGIWCQETTHQEYNDLNQALLEYFQKMYPLPETAYWLNPTCDGANPDGVYIPKNLADSFIELDRMLTSEFKEHIKTHPKNDMILYHLGLGMWLRNNWGLWVNSRLAQYFKTICVYHPDHMSGVLLYEYWDHLNDCPLLSDEEFRANNREHCE